MTPEQSKALAALLCRTIDYWHAVQNNNIHTAREAEQRMAEALQQVEED